MHDDDIGLETIAHSGGQIRVPARTTRYVVKRSEIASTLSGAGWDVPLFNIATTTYTLVFTSYNAFSGKNVWAKARVRTWHVNGVMLPLTITPSVQEFNADPAAQRPNDRSARGGLSSMLQSDNAGSWDGNTYVKWNVRVQKSRFCYWIIDLVEVKLPDISDYQVTG